MLKFLYNLCFTTDVKEPEKTSKKKNVNVKKRIRRNKRKKIKNSKVCPIDWDKTTLTPKSKTIYIKPYDTFVCISPKSNIT